jgi:hypothetical protein
MSLVFNPITDEFVEVGSDELSELVNDPDMIEKFTIPLDNNPYLKFDNSSRYIKILNKHPTIKPVTVSSSSWVLYPSVESVESSYILPEIKNTAFQTSESFGSYEDIPSFSVPSPQYSMTDLPSITIRDDNLLQPYTQ